MRHRPAAFAVAALLLACGCAPVTTVRGSAPAATPGGAPAGARLYPQGGSGCTTPCRIDLGAYPDEFELQIEVEGFQPSRVMIRHRGESWQADITDLGGVPCLAIDTQRGDVYAADYEDIRRTNPVDAVTLGVGQSGMLYAVVVTGAARTWQRVTQLWPG